VTARRRAGRLVGAALIVLGLVALREGWRLLALRESLVAGATVGDDTFPLTVGAGLLGLGVVVLLAGLPHQHVELPTGHVRAQMLSAAGALVAYWVLAPWLGYTAATALVALALYRTMGGYRWPATLFLAAVSTGALYLVFRVWLHEPLPTGLLGR
jgi:putative tricarboxylic transport membrane protein